jgi:branched-chain amino acid transport system substrate-binding protein
MKKSWIWIIGIILVVAIVGGLYIFNQQKSNDVKIGFISPMSGNAAAYGDYSRKAFQIGVDEWNSENNLQIKVIYEDGKCAPADAVNAANKLINIDKVDYVMTFCTGETNAVSPITDSNKIILLTSGTTAPNIKKGGYLFRNIASFETGLPKLTQLAYDYNKQIALISENTDYAASAKESFKNKYSALGGTIAFDESFDAKNADFRTIISKLKSENISSIFVVVQSFETSAVLFKQMKELDYHPQIFATEGSIGVKALDKYTKEGYEDIVEGVVFITTYFDRTNPKTSHLLEVYAAKYNSTAGPVSESYLATHYDAVFLIGEATTAVGANPDLVKQYFLTNIKDWEGAVGKFSFDKTGDAVQVMQVNTVKDAKIILYEA